MPVGGFVRQYYDVIDGRRYPSREEQRSPRFLNILVGESEDKMKAVMSSLDKNEATLEDFRAAKSHFLNALAIGVSVGALEFDLGLVSEMMARRVEIQYGLGDLAEFTRMCRLFKKVAALFGDRDAHYRFVALQAYAALHSEDGPLLQSARAEVQRISRSKNALARADMARVFEALEEQLIAAGAPERSVIQFTTDFGDRDDWSPEASDVRLALGLLEDERRARVDAGTVRRIYGVDIEAMPADGETRSEGAAGSGRWVPHVVLRRDRSRVAGPDRLSRFRVVLALRHQ